MDSGFSVLDSVRYTTDTTLLLKKFYHLREASASLAAAISACWMLQEENEGYLSLKIVKIIDNFSLLTIFMRRTPFHGGHPLRCLLRRRNFKLG